MAARRLLLVPCHRNLGKISNDRCRALLDQYLSAGYRLRALYPVLDDHEFRATVEDAILEAALTHKLERATEGTWVRKVLKWRLDDAAVRTRLERDADLLCDVPDSIDPEHAFLQAIALQAVEQLSPRHQAVIARRLEGDTYEELGAQLSISNKCAHEQTQKALAVLRSHLEGHPHA